MLAHTYPDELLAALRRRGLTVRADGERLIVSPSQRLNDDLRAAIRATKPGLLAALQATDDVPGGGSMPGVDAHHRWGHPASPAIPALSGRMPPIFSDVARATTSWRAALARYAEVRDRLYRDPLSVSPADCRAALADLVDARDNCDAVDARFRAWVAGQVVDDRPTRNR